MTSTGALILGAGGLTIAARIAKGSLPPARTFVATGLLGAFMLAAEPARPDLVRGLAVVLFLTSLLTSGYDVATAIARLAN